MKNPFAYAVMALAAMFAAPLSVAPAQAAPAEVRVAMLAPSSLLWLHAIAKDRGFYTENGIEVRELRASGSPALLQAVASGSADAGFSLGDLAARAIDKGAEIVIAGALLDKALLRFYGAPGIEKMSDFAGKKLTAGAVRGGTANLLKYQLKQAGVDPNSVSLVSIANSRDRIIAMGNGQVQGALLIPPYGTLAEQAGAKLLDVYREPYVETPLVYSKAWAAANPKAARGLAQALKKAAAFINDPANKDASIDILCTFTKIDRPVGEASYAFAIEQQKAIQPDLSMSEAALTNIYKIDAAVGGEGMPQAFDLKRYYDPSFIR
ncbi:ABC transporter substrate-binding protein [Oleispirillum naphthae]|uniref:ABC transporter substrate-binding protein n=1 Tax=Oleispirillum naphthae TaxID=2838853 RepID=UPI0030823673